MATALQKARVTASNAKTAASSAARQQQASQLKPTGIVHAVAGETAAQRTARTQANVKTAAAQTAAILHPAPGSKPKDVRANKGQVYEGSKLIKDYGYGAQAEALANRYIQTKGQSFGPTARQEGAAVTAELAPYSKPARQTAPTVAEATTEAPAAPQTRTAPAPMFSKLAPVARNVEAETAARESIAKERGLDLTKASGATLSLINEAVNQNVYGQARPKFAEGAPTPTQKAQTSAATADVTPEEVKSIVTADSAEKYRADELANISDLQDQSFDTAATGFDGLLSTDSDILDAQISGMDAQALLEQRRAFYQDQYSSLKNEISRIYTDKAEGYKQEAAQQMGSTISQLASMGALGTTTAGVQYVNDVDRMNQAKLVSFAAEEAAALESAFNAFQEADFKTAQEMIDNAKATREEIRTVKKEALDNQKTIVELKKLEREDASQTISAMVDSGLDINTLPPGYLNHLDAKGGFVPGTSEGLWQMAAKERAMKDVTDQQAIQQTSLENAAKMVTIMSSLPVGQSVELDGVTYSSLNTGEVQTGTEQGADGRTYLWSYNKETGETKTTDLGIVGSKKYTDIQSNEGAVVRIYEDGSQRLMFDPTQYNGGTAEGGLIEAFPNMTLSPFTRGPGGDPYQCGAWVNDVTGLGVGDTLENKMSKMDTSITPDTANIGDVFVQPIGSTGHIGIINGKSIVNGEVVFTVSESNWKKDGQGRGLITHTRQVKASQISGYSRPGFKNPQYNFGTDSTSARFTFGDTTVEDTEAPKVVTINGRQMVWDATTGQYTEPPVAVSEGAVDTVLYDEKIKTLDALGSHSGLNNAVGPNILSRGYGLDSLTGATQDFIGTVQQLTQDLTLEKLQNAKAQGATFGALSDSELRLLAGAATKIGTWAIKDAEGNITGYDVSEGAFKRELDVIKDYFNKLRGSSTPSTSGTVRVKDKASGQTGTIPESEFDPALYEKI